jgi:hypothetical protein
MNFAFVFIAEAYQVYHAAAVLFELMRREGVTVDVFHVDPETPGQLNRLAEAHGMPPIASRQLDPGVLGGAIQKARVFGLAKPQVLARNEAMLRRYDAVISTEEVIARLFRGQPEGQRPRRILIMHGPASRAVPSLGEAAECDLLLVKGPADVDAYLRDGIAREGHVAAVGYPKFVSTALLAEKTGRLFGNANPTVLYNPHKEPRLSSWKAFFEPLVEGFTRDRSMNLIVAPHVKMFRRRPEAVRRALRARSDATILVDPGSNRSLDNTYTENADIYLGDVSSQAFEFIARPRPCVFLNPRKIEWRGNPHFHAWEMGEVIEHPDELMPAIQRAAALHDRYRAIQERVAREVLGDTGPSSVARSADRILEYMAHGRVDP